MNDDQTFRATLTGLAFGGAAIGTITAGDAALIGKKAFIPGGISGEEVEAKIISEEKSFLNGELVSVLSASPARIDPPCEYYGRCGGCNLQHMNLQAQRAAKLSMVQSHLLRQGKLSPKEPPFLIGERLPGLHYRNRVQFHADTDNNVGFYKQKSGEVVDIEKCLIASQAINTALLKCRELVKANQLGKFIANIVVEEISDKIAVLFKLNESTEPADVDKFKVFEGLFGSLQVRHFGRKDFLYQSEDGRENNDSTLGHFSQVNRAGNAELVNYVLSVVSGEKITEFYAGAGNFSIPLAKAGKTVQAVEVDEALVAHGKTLANNLGLSARLGFFASSAEAYIKRNSLLSTVLLDPPRSGAAQVVKQIKPNKVEEIVYVSCNLPSLARDLKTLVDAGFTLNRVAVLDMFAQTHHVEIVSTLSVN